MAGGINKLNVKAIEAWVKDPARSPKKLSDGAGLHLKVSAAGTPSWLLKYYWDRKERLISFGVYPEVSLAEARSRRDEARALLRDNRDPVAQRRAARVEAAIDSRTRFSDVAESWLAKRRPGWSESHYKTVSETLGRHILPKLGSLPISEVTAPLVASVLELLHNRYDTAQKVRQICQGIFRLAQAQGKFRGDNPADAAREVITRRRRAGRLPALLTWPELGAILRDSKRAHLSPTVHQAHRLCAFTAARLGNVIAARWEHFNLDDAWWTIPRAEMKAQDRHFDHIVFLAPHIVTELRAWRDLQGVPTRGFLFPSVAGANRHITHESVEKVYRVTLGLKGKHTPHGWRSAFSTLARDAGHDRDAVEMALDHVHDNDVARTYDRGERRELRRKLAAWWSERLTAAERQETT